MNIFSVLVNNNEHIKKIRLGYISENRFRIYENKWRMMDCNASGLYNLGYIFAR